MITNKLCFGCLVLMLEIVSINAEVKRRIDWVGEPNHRQPQDPVYLNQPERVQRMYDDLRQTPIDPNIIEGNDDEDDLQQRQVPIFGKGTYLEFTQQQKPKE